MTTPTNSIDEELTKKSGTMTWRRRNLFNPKTIKKSVTITWKQRVQLLFKRSKYSIDTDDEQTTITRYKLLNDVAYILEVKHYDN